MTGTPVKLLLDEHVWKELTKILKARGYDAVSIVDVNRSADDEPILELATSQGRAVLTFNVSDFAPLSQVWYEAGKEHAGIVLSHQVSNAELTQRTIRLLQTLSAEELRNNVRRLEDFK